LCDEDKSLRQLSFTLSALNRTLRQIWTTSRFYNTVARMQVRKVGRRVLSVLVLLLLLLLLLPLMVFPRGDLTW
jgi:hypothetical protein